MTAYATLLRRLARAMSVLDWPGARTPSAAPGEAAELLLQLNAEDFPTEELERRCRSLCAELAEFARSSESRGSDLLRERDELAVFCESLKQLLAKCLAEVRIKSDVVSALCASCRTHRETDPLATWVHRWEHFADPNLWWMEIYRIVKCRCTKIFSQFEYVENVGTSPPIELEDGPACFDLGLPDLVSTVTSYEWTPVRVNAPQRSAKFPKRQRSLWMARITDDPLRSLLHEVYAAVDFDHRVLAAIGIRTAVDRGMQLLGAGSATGFAQRWNALVREGMISPEDRGWLQKLTGAGSAAAHRGWRPTRDEIEAMLDGMEHFLQRSDLKTRTARIDYPARQRPHISSTRLRQHRKPTASRRTLMPEWLTSAQQKRPRKMKRNKESERARTSASPVAGRAEPILEAVGASQPLTPDEVLTKVRQLGLSTPREAAAMIREDREGR